MPMSCILPVVTFCPSITTVLMEPCDAPSNTTALLAMPVIKCPGSQYVATTVHSGVFSLIQFSASNQLSDKTVPWPFAMLRLGLVIKISDRKNEKYYENCCCY